jgi:hypothetical protein
MGLLKMTFLEIESGLKAGFFMHRIFPLWIRSCEFFKKDLDI